MPSKKLSKFEKEATERRARGRAAWGFYGAYVREQNFEQEREKLRSQGLSEKEISERLNPRTNHFIIG